MIARLPTLWALVLGLLACFGAAVAAGEDAAPDVTSFALPNGLEVVVISDRRAPAVTQMLLYRAGAADEPPGQSGVAHFLEHLLFKGTPRYPGDFSRAVAALGGSDNAFTAEDHTVYVQRVAARHLPLVMAMEADRMRNAAFTPADVEAERNVILEERRSRVEAEPSAILAEQMRAALWLNLPRGRPVIGWEHEIEAITADQARAFYGDRYVPGNAVLVLAGDIGAAEARALAEQHFGAIAEQPVPARPDLTEPPQPAERRVIYRDERVAQPVLMRSYVAPVRHPGDQAEAAALSILSTLLGGGESAVLSEVLERQRGVALAAVASYDATARGGNSFTISLVPAEGVGLAEAEAALDEVLAAFLADGPDGDDLERVRIRLNAAEIYRRDRQQSLAYVYAQALSAGLGPEDVADWPAALQAVTAADVTAAARDVLRREQSVTGWLTGPETAGEEAAE